MPRPVNPEEVDRWRGSNLKIVREGETVEFEVISPCFYEILEGEEDLTGKASPYNSVQIEIIDLADENEKVLVVQRQLGYCMKQALEKDGYTLNDLKGGVFRATRYDQYEWDVTLIGHKKQAEARVTQSPNTNDSKSEGDLKSTIMSAVTEFFKHTKTASLTELTSFVSLSNQGKIKRQRLKV